MRTVSFLLTAVLRQPNIWDRADKPPLGTWKGEHTAREVSLDHWEMNLDGDNKKLFLQFMREMLQWRPEDRKSAKQLLEHPWLIS